MSNDESFISVLNHFFPPPNPLCSRVFEIKESVINSLRGRKLFIFSNFEKRVLLLRFLCAIERFDSEKGSKNVLLTVPQRGAC